MANTTNKKVWWKINFALILLILVLLLTIWLYWYNSYIESDNKKIEDRITDKNKEIEKIKKDKNIQIYALIRKNERTLTKLENYSDITKIMNAMSYIEDNYYLTLDWFNYSNWVLNTRALTTMNNDNAYNVVSKFISRYRKDKSKWAIFNLPFISRVVWNEQIKFNLTLKVKENLKK